MLSSNTITGPNYENTRYNKGVEAKDNECLIGDGTVDSPKSCNGSLYSQVRNVINRLAENDDEDFSVATNASSAIGTEDSNSYLQVTIKKHHSKKELGRPSLKGLEKTVSYQSPPKHDKRPTLDNFSTPSQASTPSKRKGNNGPFRNTDSPKKQEKLDTCAAPGLYVLTQPMVLTPYPNYICPMQKGQGDSEKLEHLPKLKPNNDTKKSEYFDQNCKIDTNNVGHEDERQSETSSPATGKQWLYDKDNKYKIHKGVTASTNQFTTNKEEKSELYYFDHGNPNYFATTDFPPETCSEDLTIRMEMAATKFWAEVFGVAYVAVTFLTTFILQLERFILSGIIRPVLIGFVQTLSDYLLKPFLAVLFNAVIQPPLLFLYNVVASVCNIFKPIAKCVGYFGKEVARLLKSFRDRIVKTKDNADILTQKLLRKSL